MRNAFFILLLITIGFAYLVIKLQNEVSTYQIENRDLKAEISEYKDLYLNQPPPVIKQNENIVKEKLKTIIKYEKQIKTDSVYIISSSFEDRVKLFNELLQE